MTSEVTARAAGFWYDDGSRIDAVDVLNALRRYRTAEGAAQRRAREALGIGENAVLALRALVAADEENRTINAKDLADRLGITAASTSALVDRLVRSGHVERRPDPTDRRGVILSASGPAMRRALQVFDEVDDRTLAAIERLPAEDVDVVVEFLDAMTAVVTGIDVDPHDGDEPRGRAARDGQGQHARAARDDAGQRARAARDGHGQRARDARA